MLSTILSTFTSFLIPLLVFALVLLLIIGSPVLLYGLYFCVMTYGKYLIGLKKKKYKRVEKDINSKDIKRSLFQRLFIDLPKIYLHDLANNDPNEFKEYGIHLFCGEQGSGKTISMCELMMRLKSKYPRLNILCNFSYELADAEIESIKDIGISDNGTNGQIYSFDELMAELTCKDSGNIPPELLSEFCQQRKQRSCIFGTAQVFSRVVKELREQTLYVYVPKTWLNCLTIVNVCKPCDYDMETQKFKKSVSRYFFVHTLELRNCYDTYEKIKKKLKKEYEPRQDSTVVCQFTPPSN